MSQNKVINHTKFPVGQLRNTQYFIHTILFNIVTYNIGQFIFPLLSFYWLFAT